MPSKRLVIFSLLIFGLVSVALMQTPPQPEEQGLKAGQNYNVVGGTDPFTGDPYLQRQNEPTLAFSTRNVMNILVGMNDYRTIDVPFADVLPGAVINQPAADAWLSYAQSNDGGRSWKSALLPGYPQDISDVGNDSPIKGYGTAADPVVRAGTNGLFYMAGVAFNRNQKNGNPVFVSRFIDNNNKEFESAIEYVDTNIWNTADNDVFFDKPWLEVDGPHGVGQRVTIAGQSIPESNVYLAYAAFRGVGVATTGYTGLKLDGSLTSQIYFQRSTDCGQTWEPPVIFDSGHDINQGVSIAVDPRNNGQVICAWRTFGAPYDAIMAAVSTNGGVDWDRVVEVAAFPSYPNGAFDQPTADTLFRTNTYPSVAIDQNGYIYVVFTQKGLGPHGEARLMIATSTDGLNWSIPKRVDSLADQLKPGNQFQPSITIAAGKMLIAWVDQRYDVVGIEQPWMFNDYFIEETYPVRHTLDIRVAQAAPTLNPVFSDSIQVSRYLWAFIGGQAMQLQYYTPGDRIFSLGTKPFIGDYIDIAPSPRFLPKGNGWVFNKDPNPATTFQVAWTDNRDVLGNLEATYNPPLGGGCNEDATGIRNQNVYTSRISEGIIAGSPGNTKPLNIKRAFVVQAKNTTAFDKSVRFEVDPNTVPYARFWEAGIEYEFLNRTIPAYSSYATTVLVDPYGDEYAPVFINILEEGTIVSQVMLNPDPTNPEILDPIGGDPNDPMTPHIVNDEVHTPHIVNWTYEEVNPHIVNYDPTNPHIVNTDMVTPHIVNEDLENPHIVNETINPHIVNPHIVNVAPGSTGSDTIYTVENAGNTTSSYSLGTYPADVPEGLLVQILVYKIYTTPTSQGCNLNQSEHHELLVNHTNPHIVNTTVGTASQRIGSMLQENEDVWDAHFYLQPGEQAYIVYRTYNPDPQNIHFDDPLVPKITSDVANVWDGNLGQLPAFPLLVVTTAVDAGIAGEPFNADIQAFGGTGPYTWELIGAPTGMWIDSNGMINWESPIEGTHNFTVKVTDEGNPEQIEEQSFTLTVVAKLVIDDSVGLYDGVVGGTYTGVQMIATGGSGNYTWSLDTAPDWMAIDADTGMISASDVPDADGTFPVVVRVTDPGPPQQTDTYATTVRIAQPPVITTESLSSGVNGWPYNATVEAQYGLPDYTWDLVWEPGEEVIDWITIDPYTGMLYGTPTVAGGVTITVRVTDGSDPTPLTATKSFSFTIYDALSISTTQEDVGPAYVGTPFSVTFEAQGGLQPFSWSLASDSGPLPDGLSLASEGVLSGVPVYDPQATYPQDYPIKVTVTDAFVPAQEHTVEFTITLHPKEATWAVFPQAAGETEANAIATDPEGNVYVVGKIITGGLDSDLYVAKYNVDGQFGWEQIIDGGQGGNDEAEAIAVDSASDATGIYVTGYVTGPNGDADMFLIKFSFDGQELWRERIDGGYGDDKASAIAVKGGLVFITGFSTGKTSGEDYQTYVYSNTGMQQWGTDFDGPAHQGDFAKAIAISESGRISITGASYRGNKNSGHLDYHTITYDSSGNEIWEARYDGKENGDDEALAISVDLEDNVYITGRSELSKKKVKDYDYYTIKYDAAGEVVWEVRYDSGNGHDEASAIAADSTGVYVTGYVTGASTGADYYTVKYDLTDGHVIQEARYDAANGEDKATGLALDTSGVVVTGWSKPGTASNADIYTVKYTTALTDMLWESWYDSDGSDDFAVAIVKSLSGDVYVTGISQTGLTTTMVTLKY